MIIKLGQKVPLLNSSMFHFLIKTYTTITPYRPIRIIFLICTISLKINAQNKDIVFNVNQKKYKAFTSLKDARSVPPDSVYGLVLSCEGLRSFPTEVLNYKNLQYLDFSPASWHEDFVYRKLTKCQKKKYQKSKERHIDAKIYFYKPNRFRNIPDQIAQLKKLEFLSILNIEFDYDNLYRLENILPNTLIDPSWNEIKTDRDSAYVDNMETLEKKKFFKKASRR